MEENAMTGDKRAETAVSLWLPSAVWEAFRIACAQHHTMPSMQVALLLQRCLATWQAQEHDSDWRNNHETP